MGSRFYGSLSITQAFSTLSSGFHIADLVIPQAGYHKESSAGLGHDAEKRKYGKAVRWGPAQPQSLEREYDLPCSPPEQVLVAAESIEWKGQEVGEAKKAVAEF